MAGERETVMLGYDTPATVPDLLDRLASAAEHLLRDHDCDQHGWEGVERSVRQAREAANRIRTMMAPPPAPPKEAPPAFNKERPGEAMSKDPCAPKEAEGREAAALEVLRAVEWSVQCCAMSACPKCRWHQLDGHAPGCALASALGQGG